MKKFFRSIRQFFLPPADATTSQRIIPLVTIAIVMLVGFVAFNVAWEETNSVAFCGLTCHTMPPQYITHMDSPHTNVLCEDCHMGRGRLAELIPRKARYSWQTGTAMLLNSYEFPIHSKNMAPAREACENCHKPEKFSTDTLVEIKHFAEDEANTPTSTFMVVKTGGGSERQGLGFGIHWHIENPVYFYAADELQQDIPYVVVQKANGSKTEYIDVESGFNPDSIDQSQLIQMDCITCHNRTAHEILSPQGVVDSLLERGLISAEIPEIKKKAVELVSQEYETEQEALSAIATLTGYYSQNWPDFFALNSQLVNKAIVSLQENYKRTHFPEQEMKWDTHPDNLAHQRSPGCFRCHDGKHLTRRQESIRLECNLCHSIPVVSAANQLTTNLEMSKGFEPESHKHANWIGMHRDVFDQTCAGCHTVEDPGGTSNTSFCSNSVCHGANWEFAGFDAPKLREILVRQSQSFIQPTPTPQPEPPAGQPGGPITFATLQPVLEAKCGACHGANAMKNFNVLTYAALMQGGDSGAAVVAGSPDESLLVKVQTDAQPHFGQFSPSELQQVIEWIEGGALEK